MGTSEASGSLESAHPLEPLREQLRQIERDLDAGTYRPGPWAAFLRAANRYPPHKRAALAEQASRVSNKLHRRHVRYTVPFALALLLEIGATVAGVLLLRRGLGQRSPLAVSAATLTLSTTFQPLVKTSVGQALGIRYSYAYMTGGEPRFKMRYGSYLIAPRWKRVLFHLAGTIGSPLALWLVGAQAAPKMPRTAAVCKVLFWLLGSFQVVLTLAGLAGIKRLGNLELVRSTSGGAAGGEIRDAFLS